MTDFEKSNRETRGAVLGNVFGGLLGGAIAIIIFMAWLKFEDWRLNHA